MVKKHFQLQLSEQEKQTEKVRRDIFAEFFLFGTPRKKQFSVFFVDSDFFRRTETNFGSNRMWKMLNGQKLPRYDEVLEF